MLGYLGVAATIALTVYGQLMFKWRVSQAEAFPAEPERQLAYLVRIAVDPWMISVVVSVALASATWWLSLRRFDLSYAYPFLSLSFVGVLVLSALLLGERMTLARLAGTLIVVVGLAIANR